MCSMEGGEYQHPHHPVIATSQNNFAVDFHFQQYFTPSFLK